MVISRKAFAAEIGVSVSRVAQYVKAGMPVMAGVGLDREAALAWVKANIQPQLGRNAKKAGVSVSNILAGEPMLERPDLLEQPGNGNGETRLDPAQMRARRDAAMAIKLEIENERRAGELCEISTVTGVIARDYQITRNRLMSVGSKVGPLVAACRNAEECKAIIDAEIIKAMEELTADEAFEEIQRQAAAAANA